MCLTTGFFKFAKPIGWLLFQQSRIPARNREYSIAFWYKMKKYRIANSRFLRLSLAIS